MQYDLTSELQRNAFLARAEILLGRGAIVDLSEKAIRTRGQNNYLHLLLGVVAMETGNTLQDVKQYYFKQHCNKDIFCTEMDDRYCGRITKIRSSADLTKEEMSMAIDRFKKWGAENGIYLPNPGDESLLREIAIEMGRNKAYLGG